MKEEEISPIRPVIPCGFHTAHIHTALPEVASFLTPSTSLPWVKHRIHYIIMYYISGNVAYHGKSALSKRRGIKRIKEN